ncbi:MAG: hypothetical protein LBJ36_10780, partial [Synergistaceae bacterium]|nr:hypothetical protein [Synergistaceae bacterium]
MSQSFDRVNLGRESHDFNACFSRKIGYNKQATSNKQQATSNKQQATSNKQQATSNKQQATISSFLKSSFLKVLFLFNII